MKKLLLVILLVAVALIAALPAGIGWIVHNQAQQWAEQFNSDNPQWTLSLNEYHRGWWRSQVHWQLEDAATPASHPLAQGLQLDIHQQVFHGPFANTDNGARWALLTAQSRIGGGWDDAHAPLSADSQLILGLDLVLKGKIEWQSFSRQAGEQRVESEPGHLNLRVHLNNGQQSFELTSRGGEYRRANHLARWQAIQGSAHFQAGQRFEANVLGRAIEWPGASLSEGELHWLGDADGNGLWHHQWAISASTLELGNNSIDHLDLQAGIEQLDADASLRLLDGLMDVERAGLDRRGSNNARVAVLLQHLPAVLEARPRLRLEPFALDSEHGQLRINAQANLDHARPMHLASPLLLEQGAQLKARVEVDRPQLSHLLVQRYQSQAGQFRRGEDDAHLYRRLADQQIDTWLEAGLLERKSGRLVSEIDLARGGWLVNQQPWIRGLQ